MIVYTLILCLGLQNHLILRRIDACVYNSGSLQKNFMALHLLKKLFGCKHQINNVKLLPLNNYSKDVKILD